MQHLLNGLAHVIELILSMVQLVIFAHVLISWLNAPSHNPIVTMVNTVVEPMLKPLRPLTRKIPGPIDWAPMLLILIVIFLSYSIVPFLKQMAYSPL